MYIKIEIRLTSILTFYLYIYNLNSLNYKYLNRTEKNKQIACIKINCLLSSYITSNNIIF